MIKSLDGKIRQINESNVSHTRDYLTLVELLQRRNVHIESIIEKLRDFQVAIPSWALGAGGTRFGRFSYGGEPTTLEEKIEDIGLIHKLTQSAGAVSLHIPWDIPTDTDSIRALAKEKGLVFDAMNSNTFQDQPLQKYSYKFGSLSHISKDTRDQAVAHNKDVIKIGTELGSESLTVWLADGSNFPGQTNFKNALQRTQDSLIEIYEAMPANWKMFIEYKPYEPNFYHTVIQDWGTSYLLANGCGGNAFTLVDLGHHLPNTNIENIVSTLMYKGKLGGFHFNDSKYGDDDLTVGSIKPYQLFLIFNELVYGMNNNTNHNPNPTWMIDASHNVKDPLEDLMQSLEAIMIAYAQALLVDHKKLVEAQQSNDVVMCQEILQDAFRTDVRSLIKESRRLSGGALDPLGTYRELNIRKQLITQRGRSGRATGL